MVEQLHGTGFDTSSLDNNAAAAACCDTPDGISELEESNIKNALYESLIASSIPGLESGGVESTVLGSDADDSAYEGGSSDDSDGDDSSSDGGSLVSEVDSDGGECYFDESLAMIPKHHANISALCWMNTGVYCLYHISNYLGLCDL